MSKAWSAVMRSMFLLLSVFAATAAQAQVIKNLEATISDYLPLLEAKGYKAYSFDTRDFKDAMAQPVVMEYAKGQEPREVLGFGMTVSLDEKLIVGFLPSDNDSIGRYAFRFDDVRGLSSQLPLRPICDPSHPEEKWYMYGSRPFELAAPLEKGKFIPLVLYGSNWYEAETGACRFCGDNFIKPDLSNDIVKYIPHFYILGIKIQ